MPDRDPDTTTDTEQDHDQDQARTRRQQNHPVELIVGMVGGLLIASLLAFFTYQAIVLGDSRPRLVTSVTGVETAGEQYVVHYKVENVGDVTAESVQVVGEVTRDGKSVEKLATSVGYVPLDSSRSGALVFTEDPRRGKLTVGVSGYRLP